MSFKLLPNAYPYSSRTVSLTLLVTASKILHDVISSTISKLSYHSTIHLTDRDQLLH